ncbi:MULTISPECIES: hypothetical protein [Xanthomonas]|uniref:Uncharacterized protein n=1 Tax=Xanthomonas cucurbitae TaxID=56453 RepID=A0A2S7DTD5_9XANT|nr:hypothetical protein [Xanthomonas cucurbitae]PPU77103.1 hypothetical protein XcuCFBP2542_07460 [Xanthomonas cucurbitae]QHG85877.1 hypothetical protein EBN15_01690 [Xanthomonas cucurbitae]WDM67362.1 hypothetical protein K6981_18125 [Xanthomonas cucurbitae]WDM71239.1 hypothetical protein K6978_18090 [Xanthomonas cucurbitae]WDM75780.1 hypothetical protein K6982_01675 [Xanthomonas cucurbitae]
MNHDFQLVMSPLRQTITDQGHCVRLEIYRGVDTEWTLEAVDEFDNSTVWDALFATDQAALDEALRTIADEGIASLIGSPSDSDQ